MARRDLLIESGMLDRKVPRYLSYPTAAQFHEGIGADQFDLWTEGLAPGARVDLYVHIPFCPELCWFCACRTQGAPSARAVGGYLDALHRDSERRRAIPIHLHVDLGALQLHVAGDVAEQL